MAYKPAYFELNQHAIDPKNIYEGLDLSEVCGWIREKKGDPKYSGRSGSSSPVKTAPALAANAAFTSGYILMPQTSTYALGVHALQEACIAENNQHQPMVTLPDGRELYRPNTFLENIEARITDFNTLANPNGTPQTMEERLRSFNTWLDSSCGAASKAKSNKLKLSLQCPQLIGIAKDFNKGFLPVDYANFQGTELDSSSPNFVRDGWMALLEEDSKVYHEYLFMLKAAKGREIVPKFLVPKNTPENQLRAVFVYILGSYSFAYGGGNLYDGGRFLRRSPQVKCA